MECVLNASKGGRKVFVCARSTCSIVVGGERSRETDGSRFDDSRKKILQKRKYIDHTRTKRRVYVW